MEYNIVAKEIAQKVFKDSGLPNIGKASIREIKKLVDNLENASKVKFVRMEMGIPGLPPAQKGVEAQIESLQKGIASLYPDIEGMPKLKQEISRFVKNFIDIDVNPKNCIPTVGSMQGAFASFLTCSRVNKEKHYIVHRPWLQRSQVAKQGIGHSDGDIRRLRIPRREVALQIGKYIQDRKNTFSIVFQPQQSIMGMFYR